MNWSLRNISDMIVSVYLITNGIEWFCLSLQPALHPIIDDKAIILRLQDRGWLRLRTLVSSRFATRTGVRVIAAAMALSGLALFLTAASSKTSPFISITAFAMLVTFNAAFAFGLEGADQMATLVLFANSVTSILPQLQMLTDFFIMAQLVLSYVVAGVAKLLSADWRSGKAIAMILSTRSLGVGSASLFIRNPWFARIVCSGIITYELAWLGAPFNEQFALAVMVGGVIFHFSNSWLMGLNLFPWAFLSAYPLALNSVYRLQSLFDR